MSRVSQHLTKIMVGLLRSFLGGYYTRIAVQARYLYRQSTLFNDRWREVSLDYAEKSFDNDPGGIGLYFCWKAKNSPWPIKKRMILDWILGRPAHPYAISDDSV